MLHLRWWIVGMALAAGCQTSEPSTGRIGAGPTTPAPVAPPAASPQTARTAPASPSTSEQDRVADAVLVDYDSKRHRVRVKTTEQGFTVGIKAGGTVTAAFPFGMPEGQDAAAYIKREGNLLPVFVTLRLGTGWAAGKRVALLVVGNDPGMYGVDKGVLALINSDDSVELAGEWEKQDASSPQRPPKLDVRFEQVGLADLLLESDSSDAEGSTGDSSFYRVWMRETVRGSEGKWAFDREHSVNTSYSDASGTGGLHPGWNSSMTSTLSATPKGLMVRETWTFKRGTEIKTKTVDRLYELSGNVITVGGEQPTP